MQEIFTVPSLCTAPCWGARAHILESPLPPVLLEGVWCLPWDTEQEQEVVQCVGISTAWVPLSSEVLEAPSLSLSPPLLTEDSKVMACPVKLCRAPGGHHPLGTVLSLVMLFRRGCGSGSSGPELSCFSLWQLFSAIPAHCHPRPSAWYQRLSPTVPTPPLPVSVPSPVQDAVFSGS